MVGSYAWQQFQVCQCIQVDSIVLGYGGSTSPKHFWGGHYDCYFTISTLLVSWWVPMLGNDFKSASASR